MTHGQENKAAAELEIAATALRAATALLGLGLGLDAVSRLYYAVFHAARAALLARELRAKTHSGQLSLFTATFGPTPLLGRLLELRIDADYRSEAFGADEPMLRALVDEATEFVERCRGLVAAEVANGVDDPDPPPDL